MLYSKAIYAALFLLAERSYAKKFQNATTSASLTATSSAATASATSALNATALNCFLTLPNNPLSAEGLATPFLLQPPCSQAVGTQQSFAEAAIFDPATGQISIYHPLVSNAGTPPAAAPVVPTLPAGAVVGLWFGFNGGTLQLLDVNGQDANNSPSLKAIDCVNGLPGAQGDVFGQVSWCNSEAWFAAANAGIASGMTVIPDLGVDSLGNPCPTSRSFEITDACPSDNVPTQYILVGEATAQDTAANEAALKNGTIINNASDEALLTNIVDPAIGCKPFVAPSLDNPGAMVPALVLSELQAAAKQAAPIGLVPLNDPDCLLTADGTVSVDKTNAYRLGVNQPVVAAGADDGTLVPYCQNMVAVAPAFFKGFETVFSAVTTPDAGVGSNLFTFMCARYLTSLTQLICPSSAIPFQPVVCQIDTNGAATSCTITLSNSTTTASNKTLSTTAKLVATGTTSALSLASITSNSILGTTSAVSLATTSLASTSALATTTASTTTTSTTTVVVEIVSFFIFVLSLGGVTPGVTNNANGEFIVLEEIFIDLPSAASAACTHQFNSCASLAGSAFSGTDCLAQMNSCQGVASTASPTASTPGTVTATATVPASTSIPAEVTSAGVVVATGGSGSGNSCPVAPALTVSSCTATATVTVTSLSSSLGVAAPTAVAMFRHRHVKGRAFGKY